MARYINCAYCGERSLRYVVNDDGELERKAVQRRYGWKCFQCSISQASLKRPSSSEESLKESPSQYELEFPE